MESAVYLLAPSLANGEARGGRHCFLCRRQHVQRSIPLTYKYDF